MIAAVLAASADPDGNLLRDIAVTFGIGIFLTVIPWVIAIAVGLALFVPVALAGGAVAFVAYCAWQLLAPAIVPVCEIGFAVAVRVTQLAICVGLAWGAYRLAIWMIG